MNQQLVTTFADKFTNGEGFETITSARKLAESVLNEKVSPGTLTAKIVDESIEQAIVIAARQMVRQQTNPLHRWEQCLDLYERQPSLNTRTSTSVVQQAYSTPIPIAYLAAKLARINQETKVYEPAAGNGALLLLADPTKAIVNEINRNRAAALRAQGFSVTEQDASSFLPQVEAVDRIITNPPFGSVKNGQGRTQIFRRGALTTSQLDHAIALSALELMKPDGRAVLILGGKMGDEQHRTERYNTQLTRGFYRWLYKDAGYKVTDHFSLAGSLYRKQGTTFPIDVIVIEGKGETQLKLPGVSPPRVYENYADLKEVLVHVIRQQQPNEPDRDSGITLQRVHTRMAVDTPTPIKATGTIAASLDDSISPRAIEADNESRGILFLADAAGGVVDRERHRILESDIRDARAFASRVLHSASDNGVSTAIRQQCDSLLKSTTDGFSVGDELSGATDAVLWDMGAGISSYPVSRTRTGSEVDDGHEPDRLADVDEYGREATLLSGLNVMSEPKQTTSLLSASIPDSVTLSNQVPYKPRSQALSLLTLAPAASLKGLENAFNKIEATTGLSIDEYVRTRLNERSTSELFQHYAAEQIDSLALAIYNHEYENKATLVGHDTGIGKTRIICGLARYATEHGLIPTIVTADSLLYADILARDAVDTGNNFNPLITNNSFNLSLNSSKARQLGEIRTPKNQNEKIIEYAEAGNIGEHDCVFTTYGQLTGSSSIDRRQLLEAIAPKSFLILDESHKAGGAAAEVRPNKAQQPQEEQVDKLPSCTEFFQQLVTRTQGFVASSATAIKDPIIAARLFYQTTDLKLAAKDRNTFTDHLKAGGVPLQQMVYAMWAESGGCIRCEKSYEGIEFGVASLPVSLQTAENNSKILNLIWQFDKIKSEVVQEISSELAEAGEAAKAKDPTMGDAGASSTNFTSVLHNLTAVTSLGLKADATATQVIKDIEQGRKPIIMLFNTMESAIKNFIDTHNELADTHNAISPDEPMKRISVGDAVSINAGELFTRYLDKSRSIKVTEPYLDELTGKQVTRTHRLTDEELGVVGVAAYNRAASAIAAADWSQLPISPIDYIKQKIEDAGYSIGEITGRTHILKYETADDIKTGVVTYSTREHGTAQKKRVMDEFQNGGVDAVITNSTTGYSLHAARTVADQRQRVMYLVQPHLDVNQVEQSIGRSHRSGQVNPHLHPPDKLDDQGRPMWGEYAGTFGLPAFKLVVGENLPTEERAVAVLMKKMAHLKANTTGNRSSSFGLKDMPDFINDYGNEVAANLMEQIPELHADLDYPLTGGEDLSREQAIQKVTGRIVMLTSDEPPTPDMPYPSLARQAWLYDTLTSEYKEFLAQKIALGENELEAQRLDLQAEPVSRLVLNQGDAKIDSPFTKPAYLVEVQAKTGAKPNTTLQVVNAIRTELGFSTIAQGTDHDESERSEVREKGRLVAAQTVEQLQESSAKFIDTFTTAREAEINNARGRQGKYQQRLDTQLATNVQLQQQHQEAVASANTPLADQLNAQLQQQQPKIDKLKKQLGKAQLEVNGKEYQLKKEQRLAKTTCEEVGNLLTQFPVGQGVQLLDLKTKNFLYGVVAAVEHKGRAKNPAAPGNWKLKLLVVDGVRSLSIRLDKLLKGGYQHLEPVETANSFLDFRRSSTVYELFDERQTEAKEKRYLVSGQVLAAQLTGKFAQVTDNQGQVHAVYLLRRGFNPEIDLDKKPIKLETPEQIKQFLFQTTNKTGIVQTDDENLSIIADLRPSGAGGIILKTDRATAKGGVYFKDEGLLQLTGDFVSKTETFREANKIKSVSIMAVSVPPTIVDEVLSYISSRWSVGAASHKTEARELTGQVLPSWEPTDAINPDKERVSVVRTSQFEQRFAEPTPDATVPSITAESSALPVIDSNNSPVALSNSAPPQDINRSSAKSIADARFQSGASEKNIAKLLHTSGLADKILTEDEFYLKVENEPYTPLSIERHGKELYLTHYLADYYGDLFIDSEMVFNVSATGKLTLTQTATQNPFTGGEYRSLDREFGKLFSKNLLDQGFAAAARQTIKAKLQTQPTPHEQTSVAPFIQPQLAPDAAASIPPPTTPSVASVTTAPLQPAPSFNSSTQQETQHDVTSVTQSTQLQPATNSDSSTQQHNPVSSPTVAPAANPTLFQLNQQQPEQTLQLSLFDNAKNADSSTPSLSFASPPSTSSTILDKSPRAKNVTPAVKVEKSTSSNTQPPVALPTTSSPVPHAQAQNNVTPAPDPVVENSATSNNTSPQTPPTTTSPATSAEEQHSEVFTSPMQVFQEFVDRIDKRTGEYFATLQSSSPSLDTLRQWYKASRELGKSQKYLDRITEVATDFKLGQPLPDKAFAVMQQDLQSHNERALITAELDRLTDRDFLLLHQSITDYFSAAPPTPPTSAEVQQLQSAVAQLATKIEDLWTQHSKHTSTLDTAGKGIFRAWNQKHKEAVSAAEQTLGQISTELTLKEQKENQLVQWGKQAITYQAWDNDPKTVEMKKIALSFELPQMQERLTNIQQTSQQQSGQAKEVQIQQQQRQQGKHR